MPLQLAPEEPEAGPWRVELLSAVIEALTRPRPGRVIEPGRRRAASRWRRRRADGRGETLQRLQRTWERASIVVCGTPQIPCDPVTEIVVAPSPGPAG